MIPVAEALARTLALAGPVAVEEIPLVEAFGRILAAPATARLTQPPFDTASMDGYALRRSDADRALRVVGEAAAGRPWTGRLEPGAALRIFTGAPVPDGADWVVMQENTVRAGDRVTINEPGTHSNIRLQGNDFREGSILEPGRRLNAADIGLLAAMNCPRVGVAKRPLVAILPGGDELVPPGQTPAPGQIVSSNDLAIAALVAETGALPRILPIARDTEASLRESLEAASDADLIVTIGGASVGDHDLIGRVTEGMGMDRAFYKVAMRPGKPLVAGRLGRTAMLGLPGNPVSALVCGMIFLQPLLRRMMGLASDPPVLKARLGRDLPPEGPRQHYLRAALAPGADLPVITPHEDQDSARLRLLADSGALLIRPPGDPGRMTGEIMDYLALRRAG
ncbi:molybdopterin molybdenumtransferase MoeA [Paracoccus sp. S-4012]|uniref:molybdopterin molybdotransferase MoeA n=1 Tax=Paracoccus sp. S-4012 TaxID=2665648 RepID=UPI001328084D|nr:molybdopterin molybdenumtransferase MoeA [Paracoccus sp. S-4012]